MESGNIMFGERSTTKVAGIFKDRPTAEAALGRLGGTQGFEAGQVRLLGPDDAKISRRELFGRKLEPEQRGIFKTLIRAHVVAGLVGALIGLALFFWLYRGGQPMIVSSPLLAFVAILGFATTFGLLAGGLIALRPDHIRLINAVRQALRDRNWVVVAHPTNAQQEAHARTTLQGAGAQLIGSL